MNRSSLGQLVVPRGLLTLLLLLLADAPSSLMAQGRGPAAVVVSPVQRREVSTWQSYVGTVYPMKKSAVGAAVDGRVVGFPVNIGDRVKKGSPLCQLLTETISLQISSAEAELRLRDEELNELKNGTRPEEINQSLARKESAQALLDYAKGRYQRAKRLSQQAQVITEEQLEESLSAFIAAERTFQAADLEHQLLVKGPRAEKILQQQARVEGQRDLVEQLKDQLKKHTMIAPFDGYVVAEGTEVGEWVSRAQVVAEVVYLDEVEIEAHVLDSQIDFIRPGQEVAIEVTALSKSSRSGFYLGTVAEVSPQGDTRTRTFPVRIRAKNVIREDGPELKSGMIARVALPSDSRQEAVLVPKDSIVLGTGAPKVYGIVPAPPAPPGGGAPGASPKPSPPADKKAAAGPPPMLAKPIPVELGLSDGEWVAVSGDLAGIEQVVVLGNERLMPFPTPVVVTDVRKPLVKAEDAESKLQPARNEPEAENGKSPQSGR